MSPEFEVIVAEVKKDGLDSLEMFAVKLAEKLPAILAAAAKQSATPIDDALVAALGEPAKALLVELAKKISA